MLETAHAQLGWPSREQVLNPSGAGPAVYARLVQAKVGAALARRNDISGVEVGILTGDPSDDATEPPLAVVCEFKSVASDAAIEEAHRLAWNFCRAPLLVTLEPHLIRAWTTCEPPRARPDGTLPDAEIDSVRLDPRKQFNFADAAARGLSWVSLVSGQLLQDHEPRFNRHACADESLLENLKVVRSRLLAQDLPQEIIHDLLARLIFVQFLFHRKDEQGRAALSVEWLRRQHEEGGLSAAHDSLESVLRNHTDAYALFQVLNERFNGDLFPGKATDPKKRRQEWRAEMNQVRPEHTAMLADFVGGKLELRNGQQSLWPRYSFDVIPLEFISSIYEEFVTKDTGTHYTPAYLVDLVLDTCLPWNDDDWNVKVLDPACGSGIFLVKAFQRLVYRWRRAHKFRTRPDTKFLRQLLTKNLYGVDIKKEAVRVACFSLYLAMCDELEPRHIWDRVKFPPLRGVRLVGADFFEENHEGFETFHDRDKYDLVVGNAPWGTGTATPLAETWAAKNDWVISYKNIGPLFLGKGARLTRPGGCVSMLQSSGLLFNTTPKAVLIRKHLLEKFRVESVINLAALRFGLFAEAVGGACVVSINKSAPDDSPITYVCPKPSRTSSDDFRIVIDAYDQHAVLRDEARSETGIWTALMWGGRRDYDLVRRLGALSSLSKLEANRSVRSRTGIIRGSKPTKRRSEIVGRPLLDVGDFPADGFPYLDGRSLPKNTNPLIHWKDSTDWSAFEPPQMLLKLAWLRSSNRFQARVVQPDGKQGVLCSTSYVSVHAPSAIKTLLHTACAVYNSKLAVYYLMHTSSRFATFRQEVNADELLKIPLPASPVGLDGVSDPADVDERVRAAFHFKPPDWTLIEDAFEYTMEAFNTPESGPKGTARRVADERMLERYGETIIRVLRAGFGQDKRIRVSVFRASGTQTAPVHLVAVHLDWPGDDLGVRFEKIDGGTLIHRLIELTQLMERRSGNGANVRRRVFRTYDTVAHGRVRVPTIYMGKPNFQQYWTRSMAMGDADAIAADLLRLAASQRPRRRRAVGV
jgi:hypothetical protein